MHIDSIYLGTWLPRTHVHLQEIFAFLKHAELPGLDQEELKSRHRKLGPKNVSLQNNPDFDTVAFSSGNITVTITEDGVIKLKLRNASTVRNGVREIEMFYSEKLGPALAYIFSKGAPLPKTLVQLAEVYPRILVGGDMTEADAAKVMRSQGAELLTSSSSDELTLYYGKDIEIMNATKHQEDFEEFMTNAIFIHSFSDLLRRYLTAHREVWTDIDKIRKAEGIRYKDFPAIRNEILESLKNISFIKTRLAQMTEILSSRSEVLSPAMKEQLLALGFEDFTVLASSSRYFDNLWQMTADYANSTLSLFASLVEENTQRELRLLQQVTIIGVLGGLFGMNIAFPWNDEWQMQFMYSLGVFAVILVITAIFSWAVKIAIANRKFRIANKKDAA